MPDSWEAALGWNPATDDAMTKASDGYARIEQYVNWLAGPHATSSAGAAANVDLSAYAGGFAPVSPTYKVSSAAERHGDLAVGRPHGAVPARPGFHGLASFTYQVSGSDGTSASAQVAVLVTP